jgi:antitoxin component YwqK of YwqJK toxin-antitoxin module
MKITENLKKSPFYSALKEELKKNDLDLGIFDPENRKKQEKLILEEIEFDEAFYTDEDDAQVSKEMAELEEAERALWGAEEEEKPEEDDTYISKNGERINGPLKTGLYVFHYPDGRMESEYLEGKKHGLTKIFNEFGRIMVEVNYSQDKMYGLFRNYDDQGRLVMECTYDKDKLHGLSTAFYPSGMKMTQTHYAQGKQNGLMLCYDEYGDLQQKSNYQDGVLHGESVTYFPKSSGGGVAQTASYDNGLLVNDQKIFYTTGELLQRNRFKEGKAEDYPTQLDKKGRIIVDPANKNRA